MEIIPSVTNRVRRRLDSLEGVTKNLRNIDGLTSRGLSFVEGKISAYEEEKHTLRELLGLMEGNHE